MNTNEQTPQPAPDVQKVAEEAWDAAFAAYVDGCGADSSHRRGIKTLASAITRFAASLTAEKDAVIDHLRRGSAMLFERVQAGLERNAENFQRALRAEDRAEKAEAELAKEKAYVEEQHIACWNRISEALGGGGRPLDEAMSLCDEVVKAIAERDTLRAQLATSERHVATLREALTNLFDLWECNRAHWAPGFERGEAASKQAKQALIDTAPKNHFGS